MKVLSFSSFVKVVVSQNVKKELTSWWLTRWKNKAALSFQDISESFKWAHCASVTCMGGLVTATTEDHRNLFLPYASPSKERAVLGVNFFFFKLTILFYSWVCHFLKRNFKITIAYFSKTPFSLTIGPSTYFHSLFVKNLPIFPLFPMLDSKEWQ